LGVRSLAGAALAFVRFFKLTSEQQCSAAQMKKVFLIAECEQVMNDFSPAEWHRWFAWYPVSYGVLPESGGYVWLRWVERKIDLSNPKYPWMYRVLADVSNVSK
jgi:hypothetical protein